MEITREMVEEALDFYRLDDPDYRKNCFDCVEEIKGNEALGETIDMMREAFFVSENDEKRSLIRKQTIKEIFKGVKSNYIGNVVFFSGCRQHKEGIKKRGFDEFQTERQIMGVRGSLTFDKNGLGMRYFSWGSVFIRCDIIKAGSLQFERVIHSPSVTYEPQRCAHLHIPRGADISRDAMVRTLKEGKEAVKKYFGDGFEERHCHSWLLCPYLKKILPPTSNILAFQSFFDITEMDKDAKNDILFFAFRKEKDFPIEELPEDTSLQRSLKAALLRGEYIPLGRGIVKDRF